MLTHQRFWRYLAGVVVLTSLLVAGLHATDRLAPYWAFSASSILLFTLLGVGAFYAGKYAARSPNKHLFTNLIMGFTLLKMMIGGGLVIGYQMLFRPQDKIFVLPFFLIYLIFTAFEMVVMIQQARQTAPPKVGTDGK